MELFCHRWAFSEMHSPHPQFYIYCNPTLISRVRKDKHSYIHMSVWFHITLHYLIWQGPTRWRHMLDITSLVWHNITRWHWLPSAVAGRLEGLFHLMTSTSVWCGSVLSKHWLIIYTLWWDGTSLAGITISHEISQVNYYFLVLARLVCIWYWYEQIYGTYLPTMIIISVLHTFKVYFH